MKRLYFTSVEGDHMEIVANDEFVTGILRYYIPPSSDGKTVTEENKPIAIKQLTRAALLLAGEHAKHVRGKVYALMTVANFIMQHTSTIIIEYDSAEKTEILRFRSKREDYAIYL